MTNREWLNSLSDDDFIKWLLYGETWEVLDWTVVKYLSNLPTVDMNQTVRTDEPHPKLATLVRSSTQTESFIKEWLKEERNENHW